MSILRNALRNVSEVKDHIRTELKYLKVAWAWIALGVIWQLVHNVLHNVVYYLEGEYKVVGGPENRLVDSGFILLPSIDPDSVKFLPNNGVLYSLFGITLIFFLSPFFMKTDRSAVQMLWRMLMVSIFTVTFRCLSFLATLLPAPGEHCAVLDPPSSAFNIFLSFDTDNGCGDLLYSSHQMYGLLSALTITYYLDKRWKLLAIIPWLLNVALGLLIVIQRAHYTIDVLVAWYTVPSVWVSFHYFFPRDICEHVRFWKDQPVVEYRLLNVKEEENGINTNHASSRDLNPV